MTRPTATGAARSSIEDPRWRVTHSCPQCGAPVELDEADRLLVCPYCRVRLILANEIPPRYLLPARGEIDQGTLYIPYWRVRGTLFGYPRSHGGQAIHRLFDRTALAIDLPELPISLGIRPQAMKLRAATADSPGRFCAPVVPVDRVLPDVETGAGMPEGAREFVDPGPGPGAFVGETVSLIYLPATLDRGVFEGVLGKKIGSIQTEEALREAPIEPKERLGIRFLANSCPECGWELAGEKDSIALFCLNCSCSWAVNGRTLRRAPFAVVGSRFRAETYLPFWRITAIVPGIALASYADLVRFANLPKLVRRDWEDRPLHIWVPAFKIQPEAFVRLARAATVHQPEASPCHPMRDLRGPLGSSAPPYAAGETASILHPAALSSVEAIESLKVLLAEIGARRDALIPHLRRVTITASESLLAYLPFRLDGGEITNPEIPLAVNRALLSFGRGL